MDIYHLWNNDLMDKIDITWEVEDKGVGEGLGLGVGTRGFPLLGNVATWFCYFFF